MLPQHQGLGNLIRSGLDYASGTADRNGAVFDTLGLEGVMIVVKFATIAAGAVTSILAQQGNDPALADAADLEGTRITVADDDDDQIFVIVLNQPRERYIRGVVDKDGANAAAEMMFYIGYGSRTLPVTLDLADAVTSEYHQSPAEGTA